MKLTAHHGNTDDLVTASKSGVTMICGTLFGESDCTSSLIKLKASFTSFPFEHKLIIIENGNVVFIIILCKAYNISVIILWISDSLKLIVKNHAMLPVCTISIVITT